MGGVRKARQLIKVDEMVDISILIVYIDRQLQ